MKDGIVYAQGVKWTVDLTKMEATACDSGQVTALKRLENLPGEDTFMKYYSNYVKLCLILCWNKSSCPAENH